MASAQSTSEKTCNDPNCPFHGSLKIRGRILDGVVTSAKMDKSVIVRRDFVHHIKKYKRYERRHSHIPAHNPPCIGAQENDRVRIAECKPISKTISFVVIEKIGQ
ncbi:30S ribosomal protein S17 [Candidatus Bathyarchaeota archaeon]|nr:30S ribosomal protein S17 [Candidatus Bathyarchaeota archaeon]